MSSAVTIILVLLLGWAAVGLIFTSIWMAGYYTRGLEERRTRAAHRRRTP